MVDDVLSARDVIESILPDANDRWTVLDRFIRSAHFASSIAPSALAATLWQNGFRLNVGQVETFTFVDGNFRIMLAAPSTDTRLAGLSISRSTYASIGGSHCAFTGGVAEYRATEGRIDLLHDDYIRSAATTMDGSPRQGTPHPVQDLPSLIAYAENYIASNAPHQERPLVYPFHIGSDYTRNDVFAVVGIPERSGGPWYTGYTSHGPDWFIFCNVGTRGRTGHDYDNHFTGDDLVWSAKTDTHLRQPVIQQLLNPTGRVYLFYREGQRDPFTFAGSARSVEVFDTTPVKVRWRFRAVDGRRQEHILPEEVDEEDAAGLEGERRSVFVNIYERNPAARRKCISHWKPICRVCEFDFEAVYGNLGEGFIHVHHLKPLGEVGEAYRLDPIEDLRPVCPNCHAMLHQQRPALKIEELKAIIRKRQGRQ
jgi:5-methylcytosine-specific restriction enzyme A